MKKNRRLTPEALVLWMNEAGWSVQSNGLVLCPIYGAALTLNADGCRAMLKLNTGWRTVLDTSGLNVVSPPPEVTVDGVRLLSFERADLRNPAVLRDAAQLIWDFGETEGCSPGRAGTGTWSASGPAGWARCWSAHVHARRGRSASTTIRCRPRRAVAGHRACFLP
jgi:hypothetical protein